MKDNFNTWEGVYPSFREASKDATGAGFEGDVWRSRTLSAARNCLAAVQAGTPIPAFYKQRSTLLPPLAAILLTQKKPLNILDFGGGLGIGYLTLKESIPERSGKINYSIVEVSQICDEGRKLFAATDLTYLNALPEQMEVDIMHSSSALQYIEDWKGLLKKFVSYQPEYLFLSDVFAGDIPTFATLQNYYDSTISHWFFNEEELLSFIYSLGYELRMKSFVSSKRLDAVDVLPMENFSEKYRLNQSLHLLFKRIE